MTDYTHGTGSGPGATMMIRDTGSQIQFWINSNNGTTWTDHLPWNGTVNGTNVGGPYYYHPGSGWNLIASYGVSTSQNVTFGIGSTGTSGFGGPTSFTVFIQRATVPPPPNAPILSNITSTSIHSHVNGAGDGGSAILFWQTWADDDINAGSPTGINGIDCDFTGLTPGTTYYFWSFGVNSVGTGPLGARSQATTLRVPFAPTFSVQNPTMTTVQADLEYNGDGGSGIIGRDVAYVIGTSTNVDDHTDIFTPATGATVFTIPNLQPGTTYTMWGRAENAIGGGDWSDPVYISTVAGAWVNVGGVQKKAVPWVKSGGVWQIAQPWSKVAGVWKESQ